MLKKLRLQAADYVIAWVGVVLALGVTVALLNLTAHP